MGTGSLKNPFPMLVETHAHLDYPEFEQDFSDVLRRAEDAGVRRIVCIATGLESSRRVLRLAEMHRALFAVVGIHPNHAHEECRSQSGVMEELAKLAVHPRVVAIGETGMDFFRLGKDDGQNHPGTTLSVGEIKLLQEEAFRQQLDLAVAVEKNVVIHQRSAWEDTMRVLGEYTGRVSGVFHCFGGSLQEANQVLNLGHKVSFTGIATFKNGENVRSVAAALPQGSFFVETDCPYLAPVPHRGGRCEPSHTKIVAECLAQTRGEDLTVLARHTTAAAEDFFKFPESL